MPLSIDLTPVLWVAAVTAILVVGLRVVEAHAETVARRRADLFVARAAGITKSEPRAEAVRE
jgi:hypothetical protein